MVESRSETWWLHFAQDSGAALDDGPLARVGRQGVRLDAGRPFFLDREGVPHDAGNRFFASGRMRNLAAGTNRKYAFALSEVVSAGLGFLTLAAILGAG
jgi:hypothetical protein